MKRARSLSASASEEPAKRRKVKHETYRKWVRQYDRECQTVTWLDCVTEIEGGVRFVTKLKCRVCTKFKDRIKCGKRSSLGNATLNDLLVLNVDKLPLQEFSPEAAIDLWWDSKTRKPSHGPRKQYKKRIPCAQASEAPNSDSTEEEEEEEEDKLLLDDWDTWMQDNTD